MKTLKVVLKALAVVLSLGVIALFFFDFANVVCANGSAINVMGVELAFGGNVGATTAVIGKSGYYLTAFIVAVFTAGLSIYGFKKNGATVAGMIFSIITGIIFAWLASTGAAHVDVQGLEAIGPMPAATVTKFVWFAMGAAFASAVAAALAILAGDKAKADETGAKTIPQKTGRFIKDYIGEIKKITWPKFAASVKNTVIVVVISIVIGVIVWLLDWGLSALVELGLGI